MKIIKKTFTVLIFSLLTISCSGGLEGFKLKKKSTSGDEFLIQKKDPLVLPPDYSKLPDPDEEIDKIDDDQTQIEIVFKNENKKDVNTDKSSSSLEKSILKKIQK